ncbi:hypothetical protein [Kaistella jeonii]|uniref:Uncharacterized protein n=1 Tax=Kaistella jeonii TaxID=266749 RepID=A0A0C1D634_9FLAO|nr:hypothetical protein [Kaistella jeonii]KIA89240.1 hypothetical protein OA86_06465 [Kaistella jeonii]SFC00859.1 hypothetical protein SAMN05421876_10510 [Kaistella jeonii]VEI96549.1 Uncharacterised protein [Kaistella jeonii]
MKFNIIINSASTIEEIKNYWKNEDYTNLLELFNFPDANTIKPESFGEMLFMAITDFEPNEAAKILLTYKLSAFLNEGQIDQMSNDMLLDKISEEYPEIELHYDLFNINQLLFKAYNGKFPNAKATIVNFTMIAADKFDGEITKEIVLKSLDRGISDSNIIKRLFSEQMSTDLHFEEAENILWKLEETKDNEFTLITSEYWLNKDEIIGAEFEGECLLAESTEG